MGEPRPHWWLVLAEASSPEERMRRMQDEQIAEAIEELRERPQPNDWQVEAWAMLVNEAARRFCERAFEEAEE